MTGNFFQRPSLKTKIALATLAIFLAGIWSLSFYANRLLYGDIQRQLGEQQFATASMVAAQVNNEIEVRFKAMDIAANLVARAMQAGSYTPQTLASQLAPLQTLFNGGFAVHDAKGLVVADFPAANRTHSLDYTDTDVIAMAIMYGQSTVSRPTLSKNTNSPLFAMAVPIKDGSGQITGALSSAIDLGHESFFDQITKSHYGKSGGYLIVSPRHRMVVTATDKDIILRRMPPPGKNPAIDRFNGGYEGSLIFTDPQGVEMLSSSKSIPAANWRAVATLPTREAFAPIHQMRLEMLIATMLLSLMACVLMWWMLRRELSPLADTANTLSGMASGNRPYHPLPVARQDEIGNLIDGFNHLLTTLEQRETLLKQILDTSSVAIFLLDTDVRITQANQRMAEMFKRPLEALIGSEYISLIHPSEREIGRQRVQELFSNETDLLDLDRLYRRDDQTEFWGHLTGKNLYDVHGRKKGIVAVISDIDARKRTEQRLQLIGSVFTHALEGIVITESDGTIIDVNNSYTRITGYTSEEALGKKPVMFDSDWHDSEFLEAVRKKLAATGEWSGEIWNHRKNGEMYAEMRTITAVRNAQGSIQHYVSLFSDITPFKEHEKQLEHMAHFDVLTGLPNRALLADRLHQAMAQSLRHKQLLAVVYLDLDGFKAVNDRHGHEAGDQLLIALSQRMKKALRDGDTLARLGGDEFVTVLLDLKETAASTSMLSRLLDAASQPVSIGDQILQVSASLGVTFFPQEESVDADQLMRQADQAMYQAKLSGKSRYHIFDDEQDRNVRGHHESLQRILEALKAREFVLFFQPKVNMRTGKVIGAEALIRWQHPEKGLLPPSVFLPAIDNHAMAIEVGEWVIDTALTAREQWRHAGLDIPVSVNVGARQLQQKDFVVRLNDILSRHPRFRPGDLELEVLETSALEDLIGVSQLIRECHALGVTFALDDFGTGYSSLTYLKRLPVTTLKIDQSFVRDMLDDSENLPILEGVINLASAFLREVVAEGVETAGHGELLLQLGCQLAQGYGIARPMPAASLPAWAKSWRPDPEWPHVQEINHDDLPLLFSSVAHRSWVNALEQFLRGETDNPPPQDTHRCRFGRWLEKEGKIRYGEGPVLKTIERLHEQVHQVADELCEYRQQGTLTDIQVRLKEFHALHDSVLQYLPLLKKNGPTA